MSCISFDSYIKPQLFYITCVICIVVYLLIPTSNHNWFPDRHSNSPLYIFWFLHQTTTSISSAASQICCISFDSYIKPQLFIIHNIFFVVVYLLIPTSNHNCLLSTACAQMLYIFWFLHQTTTLLIMSLTLVCCISFDSYIKPQPKEWLTILPLVVYLLIPTSNHNYLTDPPYNVGVVYLLIPTSNHNLWCFRFCWYSVVYLLIPTSNHNS